MIYLIGISLTTALYYFLGRFGRLAWNRAHERRL